MKFIDLFAGIGGFHLALTNAGMKCVFASEVDKHARKTYLHNFDISEEIFNTDIRAIDPSHVPDHDILCAGFPCQPFSQAGRRKGFADGDKSERGNLFFYILDILEAKRPRAFILENVRHLLKHDNGNTFRVIADHLEKTGYAISYKVIKASDFGRPQHRPRLFIVGFNKDKIDTSDAFAFPDPRPLKMTMSDVWEGQCDREIGFTLRVGGRGSAIEDRRNWDAYRVNGEVVQLGPLQGKRMQGFPDDFFFPCSTTQAMKQLGNTVCVDVVEAVALSVKAYLARHTLDVDPVDRDTPEGALGKDGWTAVYVLLKALVEKRIYFANETGGNAGDFVTVLGVKHRQGNRQYDVAGADILVMEDASTAREEWTVSAPVSRQALTTLLTNLKGDAPLPGSLDGAENVLNALPVANVNAKASARGGITLSFDYDNERYFGESLVVTSFLDGPAPLLDASAATNFIFEIKNYPGDPFAINTVGDDTSASFVGDRVNALLGSGATLAFVACEKPIHEENLRRIDARLPALLSQGLLAFYAGQSNALKTLALEAEERTALKEYLKSTLLGMVPNTPWNGAYSANGMIALKEDGAVLMHHVIRDGGLKNYLLENAIFDAPATGRHRFGSVYCEGGRYFIKLNLQLRLQ